MKWTTRAMAALATGSFVIASTACGSAETSAASEPSAPRFAAGTEAVMNGRARGGVIAPVLNVWNAVPPTEAVCTLRHGVSVHVLEAKYAQTESRWYIRVENGTCTGWVPETALSKA